MYHYILRSNLASALPIYQSSHSINNETIWYLVILQQLIFLINKVPSCIYPRITSMSKLFIRNKVFKAQYNFNGIKTKGFWYKSIPEFAYTTSSPYFFAVRRASSEKKMTAQKLGTRFSLFASAGFVPNFRAVTKIKVHN